MSGSEKPTRRDFLRGQAALDRIGQIGQAAGDAAATIPCPAANEAAYQVQVARRAMACEFKLFFNAGQYERDTTAALACLDDVERLEDRLSIYRETSELCRLNQAAALGPAPVEPDLFELLKLALQVAAATDGAYDITSGPLSRAWGFFRRQGAVPAPADIERARAQIGWRRVTLDDRNQTLEFDAPDMEINVNSLGKGYALDCSAEILAAEEIHDYLMYGGQSSVIARGARGDRREGWTVGVRHPLRPDVRLAELVLRDRALSTSGTEAQSFLHRGKRYGHILDPRTGHPAEGVYLATVLAPTGALAECLSTALYVVGPRGAGELCQKFPGTACLLVVPGQRQGSVELITHGLDADDWQLPNNDCDPAAKKMDG